MSIEDHRLYCLMDGKEYIGKTRLTKKLRRIFNHPELIERFRSCDHLVIFYFADGKSVSVKARLSDIEAVLCEKGISKVHKSHDINPRFACQWTTHCNGYTVKMTTRQTGVPVSPPYKSSFDELLKQYINIVFTFRTIERSALYILYQDVILDIFDLLYTECQEM